MNTQSLIKEILKKSNFTVKALDSLSDAQIAKLHEIVVRKYNSRK